MFFSISFFLAILIVSGGVLIWEARTGRFTAGSPQQDTWRSVLFFAATVVGGALLLRSSGGSVLLAFAFVPVTLLSFVRFVTLARQRWSGRWLSYALAAAIVVGIAVSLSALPGRIDQGSLYEQIFYPEGGPVPDSIDPDASRPVRV